MFKQDHRYEPGNESIDVKHATAIIKQEAEYDSRFNDANLQVDVERFQ